MSKEKYKLLTEEHKRAISKAMKGRHLTEEHKRNISKSITGRRHTNSAKKRMSEKFKGKYVSNTTKNKIRKTLQRKWNNPKYREKQIRAMYNGILKAKPTKPEKKLRRGLNKLFPGEYKYVGNGQFIIGGKCPDFVSINGQKKVIELFGDYWHSEIRTGMTRKKHSQERIKHFAEYGYETLIVWQYELKNIPKLKKKLIEFHKQKINMN